MQRHVRQLGSHHVHVIDGLFDAREREAIFRLLAGLHYFRRQGDFEGDALLTLAAALDPSALWTDDEFAFGRRIAAATADLVPLARYQLLAAYVNQIHYGDCSFPHRDCPPAAGDVTLLYYAHTEWQAGWGGHTLLFDADSPFHLAIAPEPGRLLVFAGNIEHCGGVPSRVCHLSRYTLALKYGELPAAAVAGRHA